MYRDRVSKVKKLFRNRSLIQALAALLSNWHVGNFFSGKIYNGTTKHICVPGLNCYSCPGAMGACPIGSLQAVIGDRGHSFSFYVVGVLLLFGVLFGRLICGFLCVFGFVQDLLYKVPVKKLKLAQSVDKPLRYLKYAVLLIMVILLPMLLSDAYGTGSPYFCKWICPSGTLLGGIPLLIANPTLRAMAGFVFSWKMLLLLATLVSSMLLYRPFCKYLCPLGAIYSLFNRFSFYQMKVDEDLCVGCKACEKSCKMGVRVTDEINALECIRCGECKKACKYGAISTSFRLKTDKLGSVVRLPVHKGNRE